MSYLGVAAGIGALAGGAISALGSKSAASTQAQGDEAAAQTQQNMFNTIVGQEQPYLESGYGAITALNELLGTGVPASETSSAAPQVGTGAIPAETTPPDLAAYQNAGLPPGGTTGAAYQAYLTQLANGAGTPATTAAGPSTVAGTGLPPGFLTETFNPTMSQLEQYPGYQFQLQQGDLALQSANAPGMGALSGASLKSLMSFNQGLAASNYNQYFNQFQTEQTNIFNRLSAIAGLGQNAAGNLGNAGAQLGTGVAGAQAAAAGAQAAGTVGATNAISSGLSNSIPLAYLMSGMGAGASADSALVDNPAAYA